MAKLPEQIEVSYGYVINKGKLEMDLAKIHNSWRYKLGLLVLKIAEWIFGKGIKVKCELKRKEEND